VVGMPDDRYGEQVVAFVRLAEGSKVTGEELRSQLTDRVARFKVPRHIVIVDEYPTTPSGKVQKFKLREQFEAARARGSSAA
jgi:fatty-acyl-CoA synthase